MATQGARARRNQEARQRLADALVAISKRLNIPVPERSRRMKDPALQPIVEIERFADFAEAVETRLAELGNAGEAPGGYDALTVAMLRDEAKGRGLAIPSGAKKADLVALLTADDAGGEESPTEPEEDEAPEEPAPEEIEGV